MSHRRYKKDPLAYCMKYLLMKDALDVQNEDEAWDILEKENTEEIEKYLRRQGSSQLYAVESVTFSETVDRPLKVIAVLWGIVYLINMFV